LVAVILIIDLSVVGVDSADACGGELTITSTALANITIL
jgi:hypothetical protein